MFKFTFLITKIENLVNTEQKNAIMGVEFGLLVL
jgi:hypothetical protein